MNTDIVITGHGETKYVGCFAAVELQNSALVADGEIILENLKGEWYLKDDSTAWTKVYFV